MWPNSPTQKNDVITDLDWTFSALGDVDPVAADLLRIATAAYLSDRLTRRPKIGFSREIDLIVHAESPTTWRGDAGQTLVNLLAWISGDEWTLKVVRAKRQSFTDQLLPVPPRKTIMLLSGGLDSFCGAVDHLGTAKSRLHVGHRDVAKSTRHVQTLVGDWFTRQLPEFSWTRHEITQSAPKVEPSTRTRSLLFIAMAVAAATGSGATSVIVPENGSTSMNVPILPSRGGALSTKSTHPWTFHLVKQMLKAANIPATVTNPYLNLTKGELLLRASKKAPKGFMDATGQTLSCSKLDGGRFKGGDPNLNCGICIACLVRRGAFVANNMSDNTEYLIDRLKGNARKKLIRQRHDDLWAIRVAQDFDYTEDDLIASAAWPQGTDLTKVLALVNRGRKELFDVPLP